MSTFKSIKVVSVSTEDPRVLPADFLNAYEIENTDELEWPVNVYSVDLPNVSNQNHEHRSEIKQTIWELRRTYKNQCSGYGFAVDISPRLVAVPATWKLPSLIEGQNYVVKLHWSGIASARTLEGREAVAGILREGIKKHFKEDVAEGLGNLWQDYNGFCQYPSNFGDEYLFCRRFECGAKLFRGGRWVLRFPVSTQTLDGRVFEDYYAQGRVGLLAERLELKRGQRVKRNNRRAAIRILRQMGSVGAPFKCLDLEDFDLIVQHSRLSQNEQRALAHQLLRCKAFPDSMVDVPSSEIRLILSSEITKEDHDETIIEPAERERLASLLRDFVNDSDIFGNRIRLADAPFDVGSTNRIFVPPPDIRVRGEGGTIETLLGPLERNEVVLRGRARQRLLSIGRNGFLQRRPINPLLAWPGVAGDRGGRRLKHDLEYICSGQGIEIQFDLMSYRDTEEVARSVEARGCDSVFAVLPESSREPYHAGNTHERLKRRLDVPSQCIQLENTLPGNWVDKPHRDFKAAQPSLAKRLRQTYQLSLFNLLVKHHWFPFAPACAYNYNVQVGLDVGGVHNTHAMSCVGYGFGNPGSLLLFRPDEIPIEFQKKEPIPTDSLFRGLASQFDLIVAELRLNGHKPNFDTLILYRDGKLLGDGDEWNELEALQRLHEHYLKCGLISRESVWTAVEIMKGAEGWRAMRSTAGVVRNPLVGDCIFPFEDEETGLVCTTGAPYLTQGTACPLLIKVNNIFGQSDRKKVVRDLIWQADLCFTKPDMGMSLPWVLNVADAGALQLSRSYQITGITA